MAPFQPELEPTNTALRWKKWLDRFENLMMAANITDIKRKKALLLHLADESVFDIFKGLAIDAIAEGADPAVDNTNTVSKRALDQHFTTKKNVEFERHTFRMANRTPLKLSTRITRDYAR